MVIAITELEQWLRARGSPAEVIHRLCEVDELEVVSDLAFRFSDVDEADELGCAEVWVAARDIQHGGVDKVMAVMRASREFVAALAVATPKSVQPSSSR